MLTLLNKARVINDPTSLLCFNEKLVILEFPELIAPTLVSASREHIEGFLAQQGRIVLKPLNGKGGEGILLISSARELPKITEPMMAQAYIPEVLSEGDKRVILVNGEVAGALLRIPKVGDFRANMAAGGSYKDTKLSHADQHICETLKPFCKEHGITLAGIDIIGGKLTEINITSPTCLQEINRLNSDKPKIETELIKNLVLND
jgi:glutathione synthase